MSKLTILYFGENSPSSTSTHRANALRRLGHNVIVHDPYKAFSKQLRSRLFGPIHFRTGYRLLNSKVTRWVEKVVKDSVAPDLIWVNSGELFGPDAINKMKRYSCPIVLYINDDPTGGRDGRRFDLLVKSLPYFDICAVRRVENVPEFRDKGAKKVVLIRMSYDEVVHAPFPQLSDIPEKFRSDVAFIGTWMRHEKRDEFLMDLISNGVSVSIWGDRWKKSPHFATLEPYWRGPSLSGRDYVAAMQGAKICIGLLSKGNRDLHTRRSVEVPYSGGLLCAERTSEHQEMYKEGEEAVFWSDSKECIAQCKKLLGDDVLRENIRIAGMKRVRSLGVGNEEVCSTILDNLFQNTSPTVGNEEKLIG